MLGRGSFHSDIFLGAANRINRAAEKQPRDRCTPLPQISQAKPGNQAQVQELAAAIDAADAALGDFKRRQAAMYR